MKKNKSILGSIFNGMYLVFACIVKAIGWIIRKAFIGLAYHITVKTRDVFFQQVKRYYVKINNVALDDLEAHQEVIGKNKLNALKKQHGKENIEILNQEIHYEPQPFYVWVIAFLTISGIVSVVMGWNAGINLGEF